MLIIPSWGILAFTKDFEIKKGSFKQIKNNISEFINLKKFKKLKNFLLKDFLVFKNHIYFL